MESWPKHVNLCCQIFGGFPLKCTVGSDGKKKLSSSPMTHLWSVTLTTFQIFASLLWVNQMYEIQTLLLTKKFFTPKQIAFKSLVLVQGISLTVMVVVLFISYNRKHMKFVRICKALEMFDRNLKQTTNNTNATMKMVVTCIVVTALTLLSTVFHIMLWKNINITQEHLYFAILNGCMVSMFWAQGVFLAHFSHITQSIVSRFTRVTFRMEQVVLRNHFRSLMPYQIPNSGSGSGGNTSSTEDITALIHDYWLLCDTVREANTFYSDQLLVVVFTTLLRAIMHLSGVVIMYNKMFIGTIHAGIWSLVHILYLLTLAYLCTNVTESADEMTHSVLRLINMEIDKETQERLEDFLLQLYNHKVELSALGFFKMNYGTVISIAGAITTYLVILVQFQRSP